MNLLSAREAAGLLHLNVKRVQQLAREGRLPATRVGRKWLFPEAELERMLRGKRGVPAGGWPSEWKYFAKTTITRDGKALIEQTTDPIPFE